MGLYGGIGGHEMQLSKLFWFRERGTGRDVGGGLGLISFWPSIEGLRREEAYLLGGFQVCDGVSGVEAAGVAWSKMVWEDAEVFLAGGICVLYD